MKQRKKVHINYAINIIMHGGEIVILARKYSYERGTEVVPFQSKTGGGVLCMRRSIFRSI
jgi:hypothetical protein